MFCKEPDCDCPVENHETGLCSSHGRLKRKEASKPLPKKKSPIKHNSAKKLKEITLYSKRKKEFFSIPHNQICGVCGRKTATDIHHQRGKVGYFDEEARDEGITLLLDERFWLPICPISVPNPSLGMSCHQWVEEHPKEAKERGLSFDRLH